MATKKQNRPMKSSVVRPGMKKPGPRQTKELTGKAAIDAYQKEISPRGMAKTKAAQTAALDKLMKQRYGKKK